MCNIETNIKLFSILKELLRKNKQIYKKGGYRPNAILKLNSNPKGNLLLNTS